MAHLAGRTVLLVTHDPLEAIRIAERIEVMAGRPASLGEPIIPPGIAPRDTSTTEMAALYGALMGRLGAATP